jgi:hypothetical protein
MLELRVNDVRLRKIDKYNWGVETISTFKEGKKAGQEYPSRILYFCHLVDALDAFVDEVIVKKWDESDTLEGLVKNLNDTRAKMMFEIKEFVGKLNKAVTLSKNYDTEEDEKDA